MSIRELLLEDIQKAPPALLKPLYEVWQVLKAHSQVSVRSGESPAANLIGSLSKEDANEMIDIINREFSQLEGEW